MTTTRVYTINMIRARRSGSIDYVSCPCNQLSSIPWRNFNSLKLLKRQKISNEINSLLPFTNNIELCLSDENGLKTIAENTYREQKKTKHR